MYAIATFVIVAILTMIFTRLVTGALIATGLPPDIASFQARSAYTGVGFTTIEAENVVNHRLRRRIISGSMVVGTLGTATLVVSVLLGFLAPGPGSTTERLLAAVVGMLLLLALLSSSPVTRWLVEIGRSYTHRHLVPALGSRAEELVYLGNGYVVADVVLDVDPALPPRGLRELDQAFADLRLLGVRRFEDGEYIYVAEAPTDIDLHAEDVLVVHGRRRAVERLVG